MKISGQQVEVSNDCVTFEIKAPYMHPAKRFGWEKDEIGFSINIDIIRYAHRNHIKVHIIYKKTDYYIKPVVINEWYKQQKIKPVDMKHGLKLIVIPESLYERPFDDMTELF